MKAIKIFTALLLVLTIIIMSTGCANIVNSIAENDAGDNVFPKPPGIDVSDITSLEAQDYIKFAIEDDLQEAFPGYNVDYVECIYISQEYIDEVYYNSLNNVYFGYDYDEVASYMQDTNWTFTVDENGQTVVTEVKESSNALVDIIKKVAIGTGVIVICAVISCVSGGVGAAPVACFFAGAAKGALIGAVSGAAVSGVIGGAIAGVQTQSWEGALNGALTAAADGYMWGAISGALVGGFSSTTCFTGNTLIKTAHGYMPICEISVGELVYSFNEHTGSYDYKPVSNVTKKTTVDTVKVFVGDEEIITTSTHPFYTPLYSFF